MSVKFSEFCMDKDNWENYVDRFDFCLVANGIQTDELKKANFFAVCGHSLYDLIVSLISPKKIKDITYANVKLLLDDYFNPKQNEIVQSYKFHMRCQLASENIKEYVASLRKLAIGCNLADLDRTLRDRFVCGIRDKNIQKQLLQQTSLTFDQAIRLSLTAEVADAGVMVMAMPVSSESAPALLRSSDAPIEVVECLKEEAAWEDSAAAGEVAALASLYAGHEVKEELVLGPEGLQPPDVAFILYAAQAQALAVKKQHKLRDCVVKLERIDAPALLSIQQLHIHHGTEQEDNGLTARARGCHRDHTYAKTECPPEVLARAGASCGQRGGRGATRGRRYMGEHARYCQTCNYTFASPSHLKKHERTHTGERPYSCGTCNKKFTELGHLKCHERIHTGEKPFSCRTCNQKFTVLGNLKAHERIHTGERSFSCGICKRKFTKSSYLKTHERIHTGENPFSCRTCNKKFTRLHHLKYHEQKCFSCGICKQKCTQSGHLKSHERTHTRERPFSCVICKKKFTFSSHLKTHERIHTGEKPFSCEICKEKYRTSSSLKTHERIHTGEKPFSCEICKQKFTQLTNLKRHESIHTGEKPFSCRTCNKKFRQSGVLKRHERTHTGENVCHVEYLNGSLGN